MKELKEYQRTAIDELKRKFNRVSKEHGQTIVLKAPTGSGKTLMITKFLEEICDDIDQSDTEISFIWCSIGKGELYRRSYNAVKNELDGVPDCQLLTPGFLARGGEIQNKQIIFVNWEKLVQKNKGDDTWKNSMMRDQEGYNFIDLIEQTRKAHRKICLIVDESHIGKSKDSSISDFRDNIIDPDISIEMSATPMEEKNVVTVDLDRAIDEGMIKENVVVNEGIDDELLLGNDLTTIELLLSKTEEKRSKLKNSYEEVGSKVNPLVLVQIPNTELGDEIMAMVEEYLATLDKTVDNGLVARWLSKDNTVDAEKLVKNNNKVEYMIFKTVIDTGWDCPRAQILVIFRDVHSQTSKIQTLGRILRTPEAKSYGQKDLDSAYVYTNLEYINPIDEGYSANRIKDGICEIKEGYDKSIPNGLVSYYKSREGSYNASDRRIYDDNGKSIIDEEFCKYFGIDENAIFADEELMDKGLILNYDKTSFIMRENSTTTKSLYELNEVGLGVGSVEVKSSDAELKATIFRIIDANLNGLAPVRSRASIKEGLTNCLQKHLSGITNRNKYSIAENIIATNSDKFGEIISESTKRFRKEYPNKNAEGEYKQFEISDKYAYNKSSYKELICMLSLYDHMVVQKQGTSNTEQRFLTRLEQRYQKNICWVWHNGSESNIGNFEIRSEDNFITFKPDFLVKFKDGRFGIFDTKAAYDDPRLEDTRKKAEALYRYINEDRDLGKNVFGGIIVEGSNGEFYLNQNQIYEELNKDPKAFTNIDDIFKPVKGFLL